MSLRLTWSGSYSNANRISKDASNFEFSGQDEPLQIPVWFSPIRRLYEPEAGLSGLGLIRIYDGFNRRFYFL